MEKNNLYKNDIKTINVKKNIIQYQKVENNKTQKKLRQSRYTLGIGSFEERT